ETGFNTSLALFALMGLLMMWSGFHSLTHLLGMEWGDCGMYELSKGILSCFILVMSVICLGKRHTLVAVLSMTVGLSSFMFVVGDLLAHAEDLGILDLAFAFPIGLCGILMWRRGGIFQSVASMVLVAAIICENLPGKLDMLLSGSLLLLAGMMFIIIAGRGFKGIMRLRSGLYDEGNRSSMTLPCLCLGSIQLMMIAIPFETGLTDAVGAMSSMMIALMSVPMMMKGSLARGMLLFLLAVCDLMWSICSVFGSTLSDLIIPLMVPAVITIGTILWLSEDRILSIGTTVLWSSMLLCLVIDSDIVFSLGFATMSVCMMVTAILEYGSKRTPDEKVPNELNRAAPVLTVGMLLLSCLAFVSFVEVNHWIIGDYWTDPGCMDSLMLSVSAAVLLVSVLAMYARMVTEAMMFILSGVSVLMFTVADMTFGTHSFILANLFMFVGFSVASFVFMRRGQGWRCIGTLMLGIALTFGPMDDTNIVASLGFLGSGIIFLVTAAKKSYRLCIGGSAKVYEGYSSTQSTRQYLILLVESVGLMIMTFLTLIYNFGTVSQPGSPEIQTVRLILASIAMAFGVCGVLSGNKGTGTSLFLISMYAILSATLSIMGLEMPMLLNIVMAGYTVVGACHNFNCGEYLNMTMALILMVNFLSGLFTTDTKVIVLLAAILKIATGMTAITLWIEYETKLRLAPDAWFTWRKDRISEDPKRNGPSTTRAAAMLVCGLMLIWYGLSKLVVPEYGMEHHIIMMALSLSTMLFSACLFIYRMNSTAMALFAIGAACLTRSVTYIMTGDHEMSADLSAVCALVLSVIVLLKERNWGTGSTVAVFTLGLSVSTFGMGSYQDFTAAMYLVAGTAFFLRGAVGIGFGRFRIEEDERFDDCFMLLLGSMAMTQVMDPLLGSMRMSGIAISFLVSVFSIRMLMRGREVECLYGLSMSVPYMTYGLGIMLGIDSDMTPMAFIAVAEIVAALLFMNRRKYILTVSGLVSGSMMGMGVFLGIPELCWLSGLLFAVLTISHGIIHMMRDGSDGQSSTVA
ncbi:MAG: hypothetical protein ACI38Y_05465, partial [Candidatus Methanomethylophilaceae archaeon]